MLLSWSYLGLLHQFFDFKWSKLSVEGSEHSISLSDDEFYRRNILSSYGDLALNLRTSFEALTEKKSKRTAKTENLEEMQKALTAVPELKRESSSITKHFALVNSITKQITERKLMGLSQLEQEIATKEKGQEAYREVAAFFAEVGPTVEDKFRLLALFFLRFSYAEEVLFDSLYNHFFSLPNSQVFLPVMSAIRSIAGQQAKAKQLLAPLGEKAVQLYREMFTVV